LQSTEKSSARRACRCKSGVRKAFGG
jgi:hypothetical protein